MRFLFLAFTLSASAALAQTTSTGFQITIPNQTGDTLTLGGPNAAAECGQQRRVSWSLTANGLVCSDLNVWLTTATSCPDVPATTGDLVIQTVAQSSVSTTTSGTPDFTTGELSGLGTAFTCGEGARTVEYRLCGSVKFSGNGFDCGNPTAVKANAVKVIYDTEPPGVPVLESVVSLDSALNVRVGAGSGDPARLRVRVTRASDGSGEIVLTQGIGQTLFRVDNLENNVTYLVEAFAIDRAENVSGASAPQEGTPERTSGFFQRYVDAGGDETGGCSATGGGLAGGAMLAALGFWLSSRRNRS